MKKFLLIIFGDFKEVDLCKEFALTLTPIVDTPQLKFQYTPGATIFHFGTEVPQDEICEYIESFIPDEIISYILTEMSDKVSVKMPEINLQHLLDLNSDEHSELKLKKSDKEESEGDEENLASLLNLIKHDTKPSLDSILDKIKANGMNSLTSFEIEVLNEYSNK